MNIHVRYRGAEMNICSNVLMYIAAARTHIHQSVRLSVSGFTLPGCRSGLTNASQVLTSEEDYFLSPASSAFTCPY